MWSLTRHPPDAKVPDVTVPPGAGTPSPTALFRAARDLLLVHREDYAAARGEFRWPELGEFNWALDWFDVIAEGNDRTALWIVGDDPSGDTPYSEEKLSFAELSARSSQVAGWLHEHGVRRGDRVLLLLGNCVPLWEAMLAAIKLGAVVIPATTLLGPADVADRIERGSVRHVVAASADAGKFDGLPGGYTRIAVGEPVEGWLRYADAYTSAASVPRDVPSEAADPMLLYFTSGTTAQPKLVEHTNASYPVGHLSTMYWIGLRPGDVHLNISSPGWAKHAWSNLFAPWNAEATVLVVNQPRFSAERLLEAMVRCEVTTFCAPPTVWRMLIQTDLAAHPVPSLREAVGAGEPLNPEVIEQVSRAWGLTVRDGYGQTETTAQIGNTPGQPVKPGSMGRPLPGYEVTLLDPVTGEPVSGAGAEGEIALDLSRRPLGLMTAYRDDDARTGEATRGGYYRTGDVGVQDADGYITYVGRADDVFKASDYRISPFELESVLIEHEAVAEAAVVPSPDPLRLAVPKAYIALAAGYEPTRETAYAILAYARENLAPYKRVRRLEFAELPKTISGKIRRVDLRGREVPGERRGEEYREEDFPDLKA
jgi:acetyl-CoA synthetase